MNRADAREQFLRLVWRDIVEPFPGRLALTWRIALTCALTTMVAATYGIPEAALSCYLVFFVMRSDAAESSILAVALVVLVAIVMALLVFMTRITIDVPASRILMIVVASLILLYLGSASLLGELGGIIALVIAFVMTLLNDAVVGEVATRGILYAGLMSVMPMACVLTVNLTMGIKPINALRQKLDRQLSACAEWLQDPTLQNHARLAAEVAQSQEAAAKQLGLTRLLALGRAAERRRLARALRESYRVSLMALALPDTVAPSCREALAVEIRRAARALGQGQAFQSALPEVSGDAPELVEIRRALRDMADTPSAYPRDVPSAPFFRADAISNREHVRYAVKTTAAAVICYFIYTAVQWQGIHTALITCYVAALGSVAETTHKLVLRICGCLVGAALGIGSILFVMPHLTSVGAIMALVFIGTFAAAWVWVGNERVSYAGVQVALAFLLTVLQGFGPTFDMDTARDRIMGVLLGNCVLFLVFRMLWPVSAVQRGWESIHQALSHLSALACASKTAPDEQAARDVRVAYASQVYAQLADIRRLLGLVDFESTRRPRREQVRREVKIADMIRRVTSYLVSRPADADEVAQRLQALAQQTATASRAAARALPVSPDRQPITLACESTLDRNIRTLETLINGR